MQDWKLYTSAKFQVCRCSQWGVIAKAMAQITPDQPGAPEIIMERHPPRAVIRSGLREWMRILCKANSGQTRQHLDKPSHTPLKWDYLSKVQGWWKKLCMTLWAAAAVTEDLLSRIWLRALNEPESDKRRALNEPESDNNNDQSLTGPYFFAGLWQKMRITSELRDLFPTCNLGANFFCSQTRFCITWYPSIENGQHFS